METNQITPAANEARTIAHEPKRQGKVARSATSDPRMNMLIQRRIYHPWPKRPELDSTDKVIRKDIMPHWNRK